MVDLHSTVIRWPAGYAPTDCPVHVANRIDIGAPSSVVWAHLVRAARWPAWYVNSSHVEVVGGGQDLTEGAQFRWRTFGVSLDTVVREWVPNSRVAWLATSLGVRAYHAWVIVPSATGCTVITEETQRGFLAHLGKLLFPNRMHSWHQKWVEGLRALSES